MLKTTTTETDSPNKWRGVAISRWFVTILLATAVIMSVVFFVEVFTSSTLVAPLEVSIAPETIDSGFPTEATIIDADAFVDLETSLGYRLLWWLVTDALAILAIPFLIILRSMLTTGAEPFTEQNASRLRWLVMLAVGFAAIDFLRPVVSIIIQGESGFDDLSAPVDITSLLVTMLLAGLLELWRHGIRLRVDQELTI